MTHRRVQVFAPASVGNVIAGFDVLGAAVAPLRGPALGDNVLVEAAPQPELVVRGPYAQHVPAGCADNLSWRAAVAVAASRGVPLPPLKMTLHKGMPVGSGLGSSSASAVAGAVATAAWLDGVTEADEAAFVLWRQQRTVELLQAAGSAEAHAAGAAHLDNVAPCLLGGLQLLTPLGPRALPVPERLCWLLASPALELATRTARAVLPTNLQRSTAIAHSANLATVVHALHVADDALLQASLRDIVAEPHRAALIPGFRATQASALRAGALACSLSGAGPAMLAVALPEVVDAVCAALAAGFSDAGVACTVRVCAIDGRGARPGAGDVVDQ